MRLGPLAAALGAAVLVLSGCAAAGNPAPAPDPDTLDVGPYSRLPLLAPDHGTAYQSRILESARMAEVMIVPTMADPELRVPIRTPRAVPLPTPGKATTLLADAVRPVLERHGMLAGFSAGAADRAGDGAIGESRLLQIVLLRFPDPAAARAAAAEIDAVDAAQNPDNVAVTIPGHPDAHAHRRPAVPTLAATVARGAFVVSALVAHTAPDLEALTSLTRRAFDAQLPQLDGFAATPADRFGELAFDRDGMLGRMVPEAPGRWPFPVVIQGDSAANAGWGTFVSARGLVYGPRGIEHLLGRLEPPAEAMSVNRFDMLLRFADAAAARRYQGGMTVREGSEVVPGPSGLVDVRCTESLRSQSPMTRFGCVLRHGRYIASVFSRDYRDVQQRAAAQYALLVNSG
ncbi:DUF7373 family lipoprotein [Nocardia thailandica]|uniref:DUF7373 family lipoprotein n=1 Tax=Nocardia thailandica TaxID=257275 RepID=UPI00031C9115|nr:hypothetical protein [Nocardia thailandica]